MISFHRGFADVGKLDANCATLLMVILVPDGLLELSETDELQLSTSNIYGPYYIARLNLNRFTVGFSTFKYAFCHLQFIHIQVSFKCSFQLKICELSSWNS